MTSVNSEKQRISCPRSDGLMVIAVPTASDIEPVLQKYFGMDDNANIRFENRYYSATVSVCVYSAHQALLEIRRTPFCQALRNSPALAVVASDDSDQSVSESKRVWNQLSEHCSESATRILFVAGSSLSEADVYELVNWALKRKVEVISRLLCEEDGVSVALRITRVLECAEWPQKVAKSGEEALGTGSNKTQLAEESIDSGIPASQVLDPNRLRRGLDGAEVSRLMNDLLQIESDSDAST